MNFDLKFEEGCTEYTVRLDNEQTGEPLEPFIPVLNFLHYVHLGPIEKTSLAAAHLLHEQKRKRYIEVIGFWLFIGNRGIVQPGKKCALDDIGMIGCLEDDSSECEDDSSECEGKPAAIHLPVGWLRANSYSDDPPSVREFTNRWLPLWRSHTIFWTRRLNFTDSGSNVRLDCESPGFDPEDMQFFNRESLKKAGFPLDMHLPVKGRILYQGVQSEKQETRLKCSLSLPFPEAGLGDFAVPAGRGRAIRSRSKEFPEGTPGRKRKYTTEQIKRVFEARRRFSSLQATANFLKSIEGFSDMTKYRVRYVLDNYSSDGVLKKTPK